MSKNKWSPTPETLMRTRETRYNTVTTDHITPYTFKSHLKQINLAQPGRFIPFCRTSPTLTSTWNFLLTVQTVVDLEV